MKRPPLKVERVVRNALAKLRLLPPDICARGDVTCHRLRRLSRGCCAPRENPIHPRSPAALNSSQLSASAHGRGAGVGRGRVVAAGLGVGEGLGVTVSIGVGVGVAVAVAAAVGLAVAVAVGVGKGACTYLMVA